MLVMIFNNMYGVVLYGKNKMLKIKFPFYLKAKELRGALENGGKKKWYYDAQDCLELVQLVDYTYQIHLLNKL